MIKLNNIFKQKALNRGSVSDTEMAEIINTITDGLFAVFVSLGRF